MFVGLICGDDQLLNLLAMTLKLSTLIIGTALAAGAIIAIFAVAIQQRDNRSVQCTSIDNAATIQNRAHCKYMYDEMARKLVAYSPTEKCAATPGGFSFKFGSRILELTKGTQSEHQIVTL